MNNYTKNLKKIIKNVTPPILINLYRLIFQNSVISFKYGFRDWESASKAAEGYNGDDIIEKTYFSAKKVVSGLAVYERDSVLFDKVEYAWEVLASILFVTANSGSLKVIDFGGGLGTTFQQNKKYLSLLKVDVIWKIVEQERFVQIGKNEFENENLLFYHTIFDASIEGVDVVLFGSSICYVSKPFDFIKEAIDINAKYIIFDRTPISKLNHDQFVLQTVREPIYNATYPLRVFTKESLIKPLINVGYTLVEEWNCLIQSDRNATSMGFLLMKN